MKTIEVNSSGKILEEIYYYDGPLCFVGELNGEKRLFCCCDGSGTIWSYLATPLTEGLLEGLGEGGTLTMREVYDQSSTWLVYTDLGYYWRIKEFDGKVPEELLCKEGVSFRK